MSAYAVVLRRPSAVLFACCLALTAALVCACGSSTSTSTSASSSSSAAVDPGVTVSDAWVKTADSGMTAAFGVIKNTSSKKVVIVSAQVSREGVSIAGMTQLHEVVTADGKSVMRQKQGGFEIPAKSSLTLAPGGFHIMLMDLKAPVKAGDSLTLSLTTDTGSTVTFTALAKEFAGGNETYAPGATMTM